MRRSYCPTKLALLIFFLLLGGLNFLPTQLATATQTGVPANSREEFFEQKIRPLLAAHCYGCHTATESGGLRLDSRAALLKGGASGTAIVPGNPDGSLLIQAVSHTHSTLKMPQGKPKLADAEISDLRQWIKDGAYWPTNLKSQISNPKSESSKHWAFQPLQPQQPPGTSNQQWPRNDIDRFILAKLEANGLKPNPQADKRTLLRRATFDLTGLPPTPEETERFLADQSPEAFAKVIERLLASPAYGERWARHWLDVARYADTMGVNDTTTMLYPFAYTYRDWVIKAFNDDLPYDQFLTQQIAADQLPANAPRNLAALGFLTVGRGGGGVTTEEKIDDKVDVAIRGTMALTVSCARCHNHKFDPVPTADYYSLYSIFANTHEPEVLPLLDPSLAGSEKELALKKERDKLEDEIAKYNEKRFPELKADYRAPEKIAKYLLAAHQARALTTETDLQALATEKDHNLYMLRRWQRFLKQAEKNNDPAFALWLALDALPEKDFVAQAAAAVAASAGKANPLVAREFSEAPKSPKSIEEAAERYGKLIAKFDKAEKLADANEEALRQVLHGEASPINVPFADYNSIRLVKDSQFERDQKQKFERTLTARAFDGAAPRAMVVEDLPNLKPGVIYVRGNPNNKGAEVPRQFPQVLAGENRKPFTKGSGRLELAQAITDKHNPLTARVIVNRVWQWHFGQGLVRTPSDFGARGDAPTHPELLDYLAGWLMENGWSLKRLHTLILLSRTYRQSSADNPAARGRDPENKLFWRMNRQRLDFESLRDAMLAVSGQLERNGGGVPDDITSWPFARRRTVYAFINRAKLAGEFNTFDFASPDAHTAQRYQTTIPQQSLYLMNSPFVIEQARALLKRPEIAAETNPRQRIRKLYRLLYGREAGAEEIALGSKFVESVPQAAASEPPTNVWQYGQGEYDEEAKKLKSFTELKHFAAGSWRLKANELDPRRTTVLLDREGGIPAGGKTNATIRRWVAPFDGKVSITGKLIHEFEQACVTCDGVEGIIVSSRQGALGNWTANLSQADTAVASLEVKRGDTIEFIAHGKKNSSGDDFKWQVTVRRLEPVANEKNEWDSVRDFYSPLAQPMNAWEKYAQALLAAVEFLLID
ncbi:MAG TPA: PSD1 and planctomycete cytochrome C domain-containing protein [Blastocatellia bacterium]|nr:PSD1 and planctomycete cytochrome C domain-containing protein [Blastocatellia bacterium]HMV85835.1 PSD1 and planctomycete cytochrome C domain-containing protein [Blastocatellia bacterium]HMX24775.1 PSD1 and planctomycete cytochrome C domain-containing protein [Blastocatellia bacterium]HNG33409.1 PSD1 and planctomycete cytochrome C domain-containing protein [Blastocatellia bacterium]